MTCRGSLVWRQKAAFDGATGFPEGSGAMTPDLRQPFTAAVLIAPSACSSWNRNHIPHIGRAPD